MSTVLFLFRELLGSVRSRSAVFLCLASLFLFLFLASFASLFLLGGATSSREEGADLAADEVVVYLSPRLSASSVDALYLQIRDRDDVSRVNFQFAQEVSLGDTGGRFVIKATSPDSVLQLVDAIQAVSGVTRVERGAGDAVESGFSLPMSVKIGLLCALFLSVVLSLVFSRRGYRLLLQAFATEVRMMRLSGISELSIYPPVVGLGVLMGLLAGLLVIVGACLFQYALAQGSGPAEVTRLASGVRLFGVSFASLWLGLLMGGLIGLFGASVLSSREFSPLP
jgi:hypothetical protein